MTSALEDHLGYWLRQVSNHVSQGFARSLERAGTSVVEWVVLRQLYDQPAAPSRLAEASGLTRGAISKLVDRLLEKGLLTRVAAAGDRRYQEVQLTAAGRALVPELAALADANDAACFEALTAEERATLAALLRKLAAARQLHTPPTD